VTAPELCHVTVLGPSGRADLAVPSSTTVAGLLPTLVRHVVRDQDRQEVEEYGSWVLQRLGDSPFDPDGTPETLDWLDGEQFHLRRAENPLPELDFDDVAEGMATMVNRQGNRWNDAVNRTLFLSLTGFVFAAIAVSLFANSSGVAATVTAGVLALVLCVASVLVSRTLKDKVLAGIVGTAGCAFAGLSGTIGYAGVAGALGLEPTGVLIGGIALGAASAMLLVVQRLLAPALPIVPFGVTAVMGIALGLAVWLHLGVELARQQTAVVLMAAFYALLLFAPKFATRAARLRGPQLPRTADEMTIDIEPMPAALLAEQTGHADRYLSVIVIGASSVASVGFVYLVIEPGWLDYTLSGLFAALILLRSREFLNTGQRTALALAGTWGSLLPALVMLAAMDDLSRAVGVLVLVGGALLLVLAALRPSHRRMLPIWPHSGDVVENVLSIALVPFMLHALGVFAWARGLAG
jgi:type VII secretion integral membrane protein EccD